MRLYHYRPIKSALLEIEHGTLHFSSPEELNDPLEGYLQLYWQGDRAAWEGLLRNYICSLGYGLQQFLLMADVELLRRYAVLTDVRLLRNASLIETLSDRFLSLEACQALVALYGDGRIACGAAELHTLLLLVHHAAWSLCLDAHVEHGLLRRSRADALCPARMFDDGLNAILALAAQRESGEFDRRQPLMQTSQDMFEDLFAVGGICLALRETDEEEDRRALLAVSVRFPTLYLDRLRELVYPPGYVVCFSASGDNSVMWGNYAQNHTGACLIYDADERGGKLYLPITGTKGEVKPVQYGGEPQRRNFFETFGFLSYEQVTAWLTGLDGTVSECLQAFAARQEEGWRQRYWAQYDAKFFRKLDAWAYEQEHRVLLCTPNETDPASRNLPCDPASLRGVIFGVRASEQDKLALVRCLLRTRGSLEDFEFYQAVYDEAALAIRIRKMRMQLFWQPENPA